jgi:hypothetical protein
LLGGPLRVQAAELADDMPLLVSGSVSAAATLDLVLTTYTGYRGLIFELYGFIPVTDATDLWMRFSTDGGSNYDATGYNYTTWITNDVAATSATVASGSANQIVMASSIGNGATEGIDITIKILGQTNTARWCRARWESHLISSAATPAGTMMNGGGARETAQDTDAVRFLFSSGNIASGDYAVYGLL